MTAEFDMAAAQASAARYDTPSQAELAIRGEREAERVIRCHRDGMARPNELLNSLRDLLLIDGVELAATPRLAGWARRLGKALES